MNAIECHSLTRRFGRTLAVDNLNLAVPEGSVLALLGSNGAGKSTTLKLVVNLLRPSSGMSTVLGCESTKLGEKQFQRIGYVTEEAMLPAWMTVQQLLAYYRPFYPQWDDDLAARLLKQFALPQDRALKKLSRGMRMKAALLSVLSFRPQLLILDEPFSGLDPQVRNDLIHGLLEIVGSDRPSTVLISSHDIAEIERLADRVAILDAGKLVTTESMAGLQERFARIEIVGPEVARRIPAIQSPAWFEVTSTVSQVAQIIHGDAANREATTKEVKDLFGDVSVQFYPMSLREIFLAHSRRAMADNGKGAVA